MTDFLFHLGALSLGGGLVGLALMAAGRLTRSRYAARWRCWGWLLLCLRLAIPFPFSFPNVQVRAPIQISSPSLERPTELPFTTGRPFQNTVQSPISPTGSSDGESTSPPISSSQGNEAAQDTKPTIYFSQIVLALWVLGAVGTLIWNLTGHFRLKRFLKRWASPVQDYRILPLYNALGDELDLDRRPRLMTCPGLSAPMLAGLLHPVLLLPEQALSSKELEYALLHELTHYRRRDIWLKALALWVRAVHWFNPLVWLMDRAIERDTELSCDEAVLRHLPREEHAAYGKTILSAVERLKARS